MFLNLDVASQLNRQHSFGRLSSDLASIFAYTNNITFCLNPVFVCFLFVNVCIQQLNNALSELCSCLLKFSGIKKIVSKYDQEIPQLQTADSPMAPRGRAVQPSQDTRKTN